MLGSCARSQNITDGDRRSTHRIRYRRVHGRWC
jgi:hypothetical protein